MQRSLGSGITARFLWTLYGTVGWLLPRLATGYSLSKMIAKTEKKFADIRRSGKMGVTDCELNMVKGADAEEAAPRRTAASRESVNPRRC